MAKKFFICINQNAEKFIFKICQFFQDDEDDKVDGSRNGNECSESIGNNIELLDISPPANGSVTISIHLTTSPAIAHPHHNLINQNSMCVLALEKQDTVLITKTGKYQCVHF